MYFFECGPFETLSIFSKIPPNDTSENIWTLRNTHISLQNTTAIFARFHFMDRGTAIYNYRSEAPSSYYDLLHTK